MVNELKPFIDSNFATLGDQSNTFVAGSSMGGLISLYAVCEYPDVFGGAACLSTHWPGVFNSEHNPIPAAFIRYLESHLPSPVNHKLYFDYGTANSRCYVQAISAQSGCRFESRRIHFQKLDEPGIRLAPIILKNRGTKGWTSRWCSC